jgi:hypothetical protein
MRISIIVCIGSLFFLVAMLRRGQMSLGIPIAYLANLLLLHVPGAVTQALAAGSPGLTPVKYTRTGIIFTAIGCVSFIFGVWLGRNRRPQVVAQPAARSLYWRYCVLGGGLCSVVSYLVNIPSIGAVFTRGGPIWMIGVMFGLMSASKLRDRTKILRWLAILIAYPILMLLFGGFLSYGAMAVIIVLSALAVTARNAWRVGASSLVLLVLGISLFLSYFQHRPEIRAAVWGGGDTDARVNASFAALQDVRLFDVSDPAHLYAFDQRLNQNYFAGLAADRIDAGAVDYLYGRSVWEGIQALVPRALWPDKSVTAGSPKVVSEMTGLTLAAGTSFGVGNVMEFQINFGIPGLVIGFVLLGWALGWLDRKAAAANISGNLGDVFLFFLPAIALIQPNGSIVELMSGAAAAIAAGYGWRWAWNRWPKPVAARRVAVAPRNELLLT